MKIHPIVTPTEAELAWAAGFFEGEGSVRISKPAPRNWGSLLVDVPNCLPELVRFFADRWGGSIAYYAAAGARRGYWRWRASSHMAARFLDQISPHLRSEKYQKRAWYGLAYQSHKVPRTQIEDLNEYELAQWWFYLEMRAMNVRGVQTCPDAQRFRKPKT